MFHKEIIIMSKLLKVMKVSGNILPRGSDMSVRLSVIGYSAALLYVLQYDLSSPLSLSFLPLLFGSPKEI